MKSGEEKKDKKKESPQEFLSYGRVADSLCILPPAHLILSWIGYFTPPNRPAGYALLFVFLLLFRFSFSFFFFEEDDDSDGGDGSSTQPESSPAACCACSRVWPEARETALRRGMWLTGPQSGHTILLLELHGFVC